MLRRLAAEGVGTTLLLAVVVGSGIMAERLSPGSQAVALLANAVATGAALYVLITVFGPVSGAHFNPAVTLAAALRRELSPGRGAAYALVQLAGAYCGVALAHLMFGEAIIQISVTDRSGSGQMLSEFVATMGLVMIIAGAAHSRPSVAPATIALYIVAAYWFTASTSFANPAVTAARMMTDSFAGIAPGSVIAFLFAQLAGAVVAVPLSRFLFVRTATA